MSEPGCWRRPPRAGGPVFTGVRPGPLGDADAARAMQYGIVHGQPVRLLAGHDQVDVVVRTPAAVGHREQAVSVGRAVNADDLGLLVDHMVHEAGILVREPVVVLAPDMRAEQVVERGDGTSPGDAAARLQPLGVLSEARETASTACTSSIGGTAGRWARPAPSLSPATAGSPGRRSARAPARPWAAWTSWTLVTAGQRAMPAPSGHRPAERLALTKRDPPMCWPACSSNRCHAGQRRHAPAPA